MKAILFDCFGVLYLDHRQSLAVQYPELANELWDLNHQSDYGWLDRREHVTAVAHLTNMTVDEVERFARSEHGLNASLMEYIKDTLKPRYKIGLVSNIGPSWIQDFFDDNMLHNVFDAVVLSGEEGIIKPDPQIFMIAAERLGLPPAECLMIDDRAENCAGADATGMRAIHFISNDQLWDELGKAGLVE